MITFQNDVESKTVLLAVLRAAGVDPEVYPPELEGRLEMVLEKRKSDLPRREEKIRKAARDMLRNGCYKPTGRGKPASEYLIKTARKRDREFPRINSVVDVTNYLSLSSVLPISLWDLDRAQASHYLCRLGQKGESYVFNAGGQIIDLEDLVVGCRLREGLESEPLFNPVKDCHKTKTTENTERVGACIYAPVGTITPQELEEIGEEFAELLQGCGEKVEVHWSLVAPGQTEDI